MAVLGVVAVFSLALIAFVSFSPSKEPHQYIWGSKSLQMRDEEGNLLWTKPFPEAIIRGVFRGRADPSKKADRHVLFVDVDGDKHSEILLNVSRDREKQLESQLLCLDLDGNVRWSFTYGEKVKRWKDPDKVPARVFTADHYANWIGRVVLGEAIYILAIGSDSFFPDRVVFLNPQTGSVVDEYWHPGRISAVAIHDIDRDGDEEILLGGQNNPGNGLGHASLAILKLPLSRYRKPFGDDEFYMTDFTGGGETAYFLFPWLDVAHVAKEPSLIEGLRIEDRLNRIEARMVVEQIRDTSIFYYIGFDLQPQSAHPSDSLETFHSDLYDEGRLDHPVTKEERNCWAQILRFPTAPNGNSSRLAERFCAESDFPPKR